MLVSGILYLWLGRAGEVYRPSSEEISLLLYSLLLYSPAVDPELAKGALKDSLK